MAMLRLKPESVVESLTWRLKGGRLAKELECFRIVREVMDEPGSRYREPHKRNVDIIIEVSLKLLGLKASELPAIDRNTLEYRQVRLYALIGPGFMFLPGTAARQPSDFYFDARTGPAMFKKNLIVREVKELATWAKSKGLSEPLPACPDFHNCGLF